jgi:hypothetical protein
MKLWFFFTLLGLVGGIPLGAYVKSLYDRHSHLRQLVQDKSQKQLSDDRCRDHVKDYAGGTHRCPSPKSSICIDSLCPQHCKELHEGKCVEKFT